MKKFLLAFISASVFQINFLDAQQIKILDDKEIPALAKAATSPYVQLALQLKSKVDKKNQFDLTRLRILAGAGIDAKAPNLQQEILRKTIQSIDADKAKLQIVLIATQPQNIKFDRVRYSSFISSLSKLVGTDKKPGYLDEAKEYLKGFLIAQNPKPINFVNLEKTPSTKMTGIKIALLYLFKNSADMDQLAFSRVSMLYFAAIPENLEIDAGSENTPDISGWINNPTNKSIRTLNVVNVGFVFGGEFQNGGCNGIDCSAFISYATMTEFRYSTMIMEYVARTQNIGQSFTADEWAKENELLTKWHLDKALEEYDSLQPQSTDDLKAGDIVVWRWAPPGSEQKTAGHAVLVVKTKDPNTFIAIECNREDDKSLEGIVVTERSLKRDGADIYVLRRRLK